MKSYETLGRTGHPQQPGERNGSRRPPAATPRDDVATAWQRVRGYDWTSVTVPDLSTWRPAEPVTVVIPALSCQEQLDRTLAALACQRYPSAQLEVVVADDGSAVPLTLPELAPENTRILRLDRGTDWGRARACHAGAQTADGEILLFLDADMVTHPDHVAAHARWHHVVREAVTLGHKHFVDVDDLTATQIFEAATHDTISELLSDRPHQEHDWVETVVARTKQLTEYEATMFMAAVGATVGLRADLYREVGGFRTGLRAGEDMEMGYRLMAAGAVFIPERAARSWHQGPATYMSKSDEIRRRNQPHFANYVPVPGLFRPWTPGRQYAVPMVDVIVSGVCSSFEQTKACVDALLASEESDFRVEVCCPASSDEADADLVRALYGGDPRVLLRDDTPDTGFPSSYTMFIPQWAGLPPRALGAMLGRMERAQVGVLHVVVPGAPPADGMVVLWRTAALHRARRAAAEGGDLATLGGELFGEQWMDGGEVGIVDLRTDSLVPYPRRRPSTAAVVHELKATKKRLRRTKRRLRRLRASAPQTRLGRVRRRVSRLLGRAR